MRNLAALFLLAAASAPTPCLAGWGETNIEFENEKPWVELQAELPAYPDIKQAIPFAVSGATDNEFLIDPKSISVGKDDVVRYALIVKSTAGSINVSFEGISCRSREVKLYAFGRPNGTWSENRRAKWSPIEFKARNRQHHVLYEDLFCPDGISVTDAEQAVRVLKRGIHPRVEQ